MRSVRINWICWLFCDHASKHLRLSTVLGLLVMWTGELSTGADVAIATDHPQFGREIADVEERVKILEMLALQMRANFEMIETWSGVYEFTDCSFETGKPSTPLVKETDKRAMNVEPLRLTPSDMDIVESLKSDEGHWRIMKGDFDFSLNAKSGKSHVVMNRAPAVACAVGSTGEISWRNEPRRHTHWVINSESGVEFDTLALQKKLAGFPPQIQIPKEGTRVAYRRRAEKSRGDLHSFDPRDCFTMTYYVAGRKNMYSDTCLKMAALLNKILSTNSWLYVSPDVPPIYTDYVRGDTGFETIIRFDGKVGFNVVEKTEMQDGKIEAQRLMQFAKFSDIFVPTSFQLSLGQSKKSPGVRLDYIRSLHLKDSTLNQPVNETVFDANDLHFEYGDRMVDDLKGQILVYDSNGFVPAEEFVFDSSHVKPKEIPVQNPQNPSLAQNSPLAQDRPVEQKPSEDQYAAKPIVQPNRNRYLLIVNGLIISGSIIMYLVIRMRRTQ